MPKFFRRYPVKVEIYEKRGNAIQIVRDKACRIVGKDNIQHYHLKKKNKIINPPNYKHIFVDKKGRPELKLYSPQEGQFATVNLLNPPNLVVDDKEMMFWNILQVKKTYDVYPREQGWWEKHATLVVLITTGAILSFITLFVMRGLGSIGGSVAQISSQLSETAKILSQTVSNVAPGT